MSKKDFYQTKSVHMAVQTAELNLLGYSLDQELSLSCSLMNISRGNCVVKIRPMGLKEIYNIGTTEKITIAKLAKLIASILSKKIKFKKNKLLKGSPSIRCPDINKIKKLGYKQKIRLKDGIKKVIN